MRQGTKVFRKVLVAAVGATVVVVGLVLIPLPGPGAIIALGGLAILGSEFPSARRLAERIKKQIRRVLRRAPAEDQ